MAPFGAPEMRPIVKLQAQIDHRSVQADQLVLEAEFPLPLCCQLLAAPQQLSEHRLVELPGPVLVGIGQGGALGSRRHSQMLQLAFAGSQSLGDLVEAVRSSQLAEQHGDELAPAAKPTRMALSLVFANRSLEFAARKQLQ